MLTPDQISAARTQLGPPPSTSGPSSSPTSPSNSWDAFSTQVKASPSPFSAPTPTESAPQEPGFLSRVGTDLSKRAGNIGDIAKEAGTSPLKNLGETQLQGIGEVAGGVNDVIGEGLKSAFHALPQNVQSGIKNTVASGAEAVGAPSLIQQYQDFAAKHPEAHKDLSAMFNIGTMLPLGEGVGLAEDAAKPAIEKAGEVAASAGNTAKELASKPLSVAQDLATPVPQNVKNILSAADRSPEVSENVSKYFAHARDSVADASAATPTEAAGKEQLGGALQDLKSKMTEAGKAKEAALAENADQVVPTKAAYDNFTKKLSSVLGTNFDPQGNLIPAFGRESLVAGSPADEKLVGMVKDTIDTLKRDPSLQRVNDVVDKLQQEIYKTKQLGATPLNTRTEGVVKGFIGDLNDAAKEVGGDAYKASNDEYARLADIHGQLNKGLGKDLKNAGPMMNKLFGKSGAAVKDLLGKIEQETGRNIFEHATLAKFAEDSVKDPAVKTLLEQAGKVPSSKEGILKKIVEIATKNLNQPEAVAKRLAESVPKAEAAAATGAAGGDIAGLVSRIQKFVKDGNFPGMMSMKEVGQGPVTQIPEMAEIEANQAAKSAAKPFEGLEGLSTKIVEKLKGKTSVSKQFIEDLTNSGDVKQVERDVIREALATEGDKVNVKDFADKVQQELLPLETPPTPNKYESVALPDEKRGSVQNYKEHVYQSPIKTSSGSVHFGDTIYHEPGSTLGNNVDRYFGHTRVEDMADGSTRRVVEVQSDLYQKGRLEDEIRYTNNLIKNEPDSSYIDTYKQKAQGLDKLSQYNDPTAHFRMVREEVKKAAEDGKSTLLFPTGDTAMKVEGLGETSTWGHYNSAGNPVKITPDDLKVGKEVFPSNEGGHWIVTDVLGDGKFKAVPKGKIDSLYEYGDDYQHIKDNLLHGQRYPTDAREARVWENLQRANESFDISGKADTSNPIYKFYEKDLGKYVKNKFGAIPYTDDKGVTWWKVPVKPEQAKMPVEAFGAIPAGALLLNKKKKG